MSPGVLQKESLMSYHEDIIDAFDSVRKTVASMELPPIQQRRYNGILNAMVMLLEDGHPSKRVYMHLKSALIALAQFDECDEDACSIEKACKDFDAHFGSQMQ
jgi:hypothetical protein